MRLKYERAKKNKELKEERIKMIPTHIDNYDFDKIMLMDFINPDSSFLYRHRFEIARIFTLEDVIANTKEEFIKKVTSNEYSILDQGMLKDLFATIRDYGLGFIDELESDSLLHKYLVVAHSQKICKEENITLKKKIEVLEFTQNCLKDYIEKNLDMSSFSTVRVKEIERVITIVKEDVEKIINRTVNIEEDLFLYKVLLNEYLLTIMGQISDDKNLYATKEKLIKAYILNKEAIKENMKREKEIKKLTLNKE